MEAYELIEIIEAISWHALKTENTKDFQRNTQSISCSLAQTIWKWQIPNRKPPPPPSEEIEDEEVENVLIHAGTRDNPSSLSDGKTLDQRIYRKITLEKHWQIYLVLMYRFCENNPTKEELEVAWKTRHHD